MLKRCVLFLMVLCGSYAHAAINLMDVKLLPLPQEQLKLVLIFDKPLKLKPSRFTTKNPARLIIDFADTATTLSPKERHKKIEVGALQAYSVLAAPGRLRVVLDLSDAVKYSSDLVGKSFTITLGAKSKTAFHHEKKLTVRHKPLSTRHEIGSLDFKGADNNSGKVIIGMSSPNVSVNVNEKGNSVEAVFYDTRLANALFRRYDVKDFHTPARTVFLKQQGHNAIVTVNIQGDFGQFAYQVDNQFIVDVFALSQEEVTEAKLKKKVFSGKRISLNFQNIKVRAVLQLLAEFTGVNIVVSDSVTGNMTLRLNNIPWDQALNIILTTRGLDKRQLGDVLLIAPTDELARREKAESQAREQLKALAPLRSELLQINYAKATDVAALLSEENNSLLSKRGNLSIDVRTNTIWLQDTDSRLEAIKELVTQLDIPVKQVLIESRIVIVNKDFEQDIGVRFGVTRPTHLSGTLDGANQMEQGTPPADIEPIGRRLNVDLAAAPIVGDPASIGIALAKLGQGILLDLELSALESEGQAEVISSPRLITANQQSAIIEAGEEIPYQEATSSGATAIAFKKAVLSLEVIPQITPDDRLILNIKVNQDSRGQPTGVIGAPPAIDTKSIKTSVLVNNGQTVVLGGIYKQEKDNLVKRVPFLGKLPVVGVLFRQKHNVVKHEELLIFITPKIIRNSLNITEVNGGKMELDKFGNAVNHHLSQ